MRFTGQVLFVLIVLSGCGGRGSRLFFPLNQPSPEGPPRSVLPSSLEEMSPEALNEMYQEMFPEVVLLYPQVLTVAGLELTHVAIESTGDDGISCPPGMTPRRVSDNPTNFICTGEKRLFQTPLQLLLGKNQRLAGGARVMGKPGDPIGGNACALHATSDNSCDRWGKAVMTDAPSGLSDCPAGHTKIYTSDNPTYFLCLSPELKPIVPSAAIPGRVIGDVCGGGRFMGAPESSGGNACAFSPSPGNGCDMWGCAVIVNPATGRSGCPSGTEAIRTSDNPTYYLCRINR